MFFPRVSFIAVIHAFMESHEWKKDYWLWAPLALVSWRLAWKYQDTFIADWDTFDYTTQIVNGVPTALGLGRALFLGYNRALWLMAHHWFGLPPEKAFLILRYSVIFLSGFTIIGIYALYKELTSNRLAAVGGALLFVNSPYFIIYSGRGMSEIPGLLTFSWGAWWMLRNSRKQYWWHYVLGAALFGLSANLREFSPFYFPVIAFVALVEYRSVPSDNEPLLSRRSIIAAFAALLARFSLTLKYWRWALLASFAALLATFAGPIFWALYWPEYYLPALKGWYSLSAQERLIHPVSYAQNWEHLLDFSFECSALAAMAAPFALSWLLLRLWRDRDMRAARWPLFAVGICGWLSALVMLENHDLPVNPRYMLVALPGVAITCGWLLSDLVKRNHLFLAVGMIYLGYFAMNEQWPKIEEKMRWQREANEASLAYLDKISDLNRDAVFIIGSRTPLVNFYHNIGARSGWQTIAAGSGWPDDKLDEIVDQHLAEGRAVYIDFDSEIWQKGERAKSREGPGLEMLRREYELRKLGAELYQITAKKND